MSEPAAAPWRVMYDSSSPAAIPASAPMVAGYVPPSTYAGNWASAEGWRRFPNRPHVHITVAGSEPDAALASVCDYEAGAFQPGQARGFVRERNQLHPGSATNYVSWLGPAANGQRMLPQVLDACRGMESWLWLAWFIQREPGLADIAEVEAFLAPYKTVRLAAWQHTRTPGYDVSAVIDQRWHSK